MEYLIVTGYSPIAYKVGTVTYFLSIYLTTSTEEMVRCNFKSDSTWGICSKYINNVSKLNGK